jgi:diaminopimelate decarboxylase
MSGLRCRGGARGRLGPGILNVVRAAFHRVEGRLFCEGVSLSELADRFGTPLYVYSGGALVGRYRELRSAFEEADPLIAYSVKANGNLSLLRLLAAQGCGADIVSGGELYRALAAGVPADRIVFSGVGKTAPEMHAALEADILAFNVESEGELRVLSEVAGASGRAARVALRVNPDIESPTPHHYTRTGHRATKFGVPIEDAPRLYRVAASLPGIEPRGVDVHIGSQILEVAPYRRAMERVLELVAALRADGIPLEFLDAGGGFGVSYDEEDAVPAAAFADAILPVLAGSGLRLVIEPGRYIAGPAGALLTRVLYVKSGGVKTFVITDAGMNDLLRPSHYSSYHRVELVGPHDEREALPVDVVGPICETGDFLALDRVLPLPEPGELLAIGTTGAYGFSMASTYNARVRPAEVLVEGDRARLIRRRETLDDLVRGELEFLDFDK